MSCRPSPRVTGPVLQESPPSMDTKVLSSLRVMRHPTNAVSFTSNFHLTKSRFNYLRQLAHAVRQPSQATDHARRANTERYKLSVLLRCSHRHGSRSSSQHHGTDLRTADPQLSAGADDSGRTLSRSLRLRRSKPRSLLEFFDHTVLIPELDHGVSFIISVSGFKIPVS